MSGPVTTGDTDPRPNTTAPAAPTRALEVTESRTSQVGAFTVRRALPRRARRTIGPWCFVDHMGPATVDEGRGLDVAPHPHIGCKPSRGCSKAKRCTETRSAASKSSPPANST